ncbi:hypothetical protein [Janthinobacterium sp. NKUCC06_STL]|uniref:hypothetical protein n=1 Tax=Janthinobacterium sp. NKUCC06_STL TaxID=2842127 RepID=UPI001C5B4293|nr:hypothetical protein [Janthinobacterium sp. NKUCC06_STL]MBW3512172.1 hypothetical protein [Janthinobacterium sp. NKUCC06_STL]
MKKKSLKVAFPFLLIAIFSAIYFVFVHEESPPVFGVIIIAVLIYLTIKTGCKVIDGDAKMGG